MNIEAVLNSLAEHALPKLESAQWREREEALNTISRDLNMPVLPAGSYGPIVRALTRVLETEKHPVLVARAANIIQQLASGLGAKYAQHAERTLCSCILKFRDRTSQVVAALRPAARAVLGTMNFDAALPVILTGMENASPAIQAESTSLLASCLCARSSAQEPISESQIVRLVKPLVPPLTKVLYARSPECREACFKAFAAIRLFMSSDSLFDAITSNALDSTRRAKVDVAFELLRAEAQQGSTAENDEEPNAQTLERRGKNKVLSRRKHPVEIPTAGCPITSDYSSDPKAETNTRKGRRPLVEKQTEQERGKARSVEDAKIGTKVKQKSNAPTVQSNEVQASDYFHGINLDDLDNKNWKVRLETVKQLESRVTSCPPPVSSIASLLSFVLRTETLRDRVVKIRCLVLEVLTHLLSPADKVWISLDDQLIDLIRERLLPLLGEPQCLGPTRSVLNLLLQCTDQDGLIYRLVTAFTTLLKPMLFANALQWLATATRRFRAKLDLQQISELLKNAFARTNPNIRNAGVLLAATICLLSADIERQLRARLADENPHILARLEAEVVRLSTKSEESSSGGEVEEEPLVDYSPRISDPKKPGDATILFHRPPFKGIAGIAEGQNADSFAKNNSFSSVSDVGSAPKKGVITAVVAQSAEANVATTTPQNIFLGEPEQVGKLMECKQARLANLKTTTCIDLDALRARLLEAVASPQLFKCLFASDVDSRLEALDKLTACLGTTRENTGAESPNLTLTYAYFDLLLPWVIGACFSYWPDWNSAVPSSAQRMPSRTDSIALATRGLQYITDVISRFAQAEFQLSHQEMRVLLHALLSDQAPSLRSGLPSSAYELSVQPAVHDLLRLLRRICSPNSLMDNIATVMQQCSTSTARLACLQELINLIPRFEEAPDLIVCTPVKSVAQLIADSDVNVQRAALECLRLIHRCVGSKIWGLVGKLHPSDRKVLEKHLTTESGRVVDDSVQPGYTTPLVRISESSRVSTDADHLSRRDLPRIQRSLGTALHSNADERVFGTSSHRIYSPPPVHKSPVALGIVLPLLRIRDSSTASEASKSDASKQLSVAISCLVKQLDVPVFKSLSDETNTEANQEKTANEELRSIDNSADEDSTEDESNSLNGVLLGALVDLETLILDPRTRELLVPVVSPVVEHLGALAMCLSKVQPNAGVILFSNCLASVLSHLFTQPSLVHEVGVGDLKYLIATLLHLAARDHVDSSPTVALNPRNLLILRLVFCIHLAVDSTIAFSALIRLLYVCVFGREIDSPKPTATRKSKFSRRASGHAKRPQGNVTQTDRSLGSCQRIWRLVLLQLSHRTRFLKNCISQLDCSVILPLVDSFLNSVSESAKSVASKKRQSTPPVPAEVERCIRTMVVNAYALLGSKIVKRAEEEVGENSALVSYLKQLSTLMPSAPYKFCLPCDPSDRPLGC
ncbi:unnamed protein product [Calicophoron daubneyi]|uniref:TOG domain-containing protein n=1 Tax=Calicophoron daubneyi TaxID=300641 RepID=A0AAV2TR90_CALDB